MYYGIVKTVNFAPGILAYFLAALCKTKHKITIFRDFLPCGCAGSNADTSSFFEKFPFSPSTQKRENVVFEKFHSEERFQKVAFSVIVFIG